MDSAEMGLAPPSPIEAESPDLSSEQQVTSPGTESKANHAETPSTIKHVEQPGGERSVPSVEAPSSAIPREASTRRIGIGLPRQATFRRQNSERRDRLLPVPTGHAERRAISTTRNGSQSISRIRTASSPPPPRPHFARSSEPTIRTDQLLRDEYHQLAPFSSSQASTFDGPRGSGLTFDSPRPLRPESVTSSIDSRSLNRHNLDEREQLNIELDTKWILNLSMHFRDKSDREKFFITFAEAPNKWRRVTVSCDYRVAEPGSLEMDLKELSFQRDKSLQIYEAIRESLAEIQFYDSVTNLKLETCDGRLHVHVTEDVNEIIPYPPLSSVAHIMQDSDYQPMRVRECDLSFDAHLSGFVYRVRHKGKVYIKKEIPGPDTVDEFLYEVNALHALHDSNHVIHLEGIVVDDNQEVVKGLMISYAEQGAVVDLLYDHKGGIAWEVRERWAHDAVAGLSEIHEEGYVQGDFTLSNIVVDDQDRARIIDINRRGCPVGWEPPELARKIASNQRISMYIGQKSDLYQLGMTLWALAMDDDEPERHDPPLSTQEFREEVPPWYRDIVRICLSAQPKHRLAAKELLAMFPVSNGTTTWAQGQSRPTVRIKPEKRYIDPAAAVERDDLEKFGQPRTRPDTEMYSPESSREDPTFTWPRSSNYDHDFDSSFSDVDRPRGRRRVSDHDLLLRAQEYMERTAANRPQSISRPRPALDLANVALGEPFCYQVDAEGHPIFVPTSADPLGESRNPGNDGRANADQAEPTNVESLVSPWDRAPTIPVSPPLHKTSQASSNTPRHSNFDLNNATHEHIGPQASPTSGHPQMPAELTFVGEHPSIHPASIERADSLQNLNDSVKKFPVAPPALVCADSGYNEPELLGEDSDEESDKDFSVNEIIRKTNLLFNTDAASVPLPASEASSLEDATVTSHGMPNVTSNALNAEAIKAHESGMHQAFEGEAEPDQHLNTLLDRAPNNLIEDAEPG